MSSFAEKIKKQREAATQGAMNSTQSLAAAVAASKEKVGEKKKGFSLGIKKRKNNDATAEHLESGKPDSKMAERKESKPETSAPQAVSSPEIPSSSVSGEAFVHPEQIEKFSKDQVQNFKDGIKFLRDSLPNKEESVQAMKLILRMLEEEANLNELMLPEDCGMMVKVLKTSFGIEIAKKQTRAAKQTKSTQTQSELDDVLNSLGADFGS